MQNEPLIYNDFSAGVIVGVHKDKMPVNAVPFAVNFVFDDEIGSAMLRKGTAMVGAQIIDNKTVLGLVNFRSRSTTNHALLAVVSDGTNNDIYAQGTWAKSLQDDTKDLKTRFCQFLDSVVRVNGTDGRKSFNGTTWATSAGVFDLSNMPQGKFVANYKDRVHVLDEDGILYSSSVPRFYLNYDGQTVNFNVGAEVTGGTSGAKGIIYKDTDAGATGTLQIIARNGIAFQNNEALTDDGGGTAVVDGTGAWQISWTDGYVTTPVDPDDGEKGKATGFGKIGGLLFVFFERAFYTWNGSATSADKIASVGCCSQETVAYGENVMFFANQNGVYQTSGGFPQKISRFIQDIYDQIPAANFADLAGGCDGKRYFLSVGNVTYKGVTINNCVFRYTIQSQEWAILSYPTRPMVFSQYIDSSTVKLVYGDNDGNVIQIDSTDVYDNYAATTAYIDYELQTNDNFGGIEGGCKQIKEFITVISEASSGARLYWRIDKNSNRHEDWLGGEEITKENQKIQVNKIEYKRIRFKVAGVSNKGRLKLQKIEVPNYTIENYG